MQQETEILDVSREELLSWISNPITRAYFTSLNDSIKQLMLDNAKGLSLNTESVEATALQYAKTCGIIEGLQIALNIEVPDA